ncbi:hypothetical protein [Paenibacillus sp. FSL H3-0286]|uniref:hypothetical protein n=1 Tax=Paenibacillus sp. FSL H3-0286 TaxID=2921427 RepID=UPI003249F8A7
MNVYKVNEYWIAAKDADAAFGQYLEETDSLETMIVDDLAEGEETEITVSIKRLTTKEIETQTVTCCEDGCDRCEDLNDHLYDTYQELLTQRTDFPCVLAKEI